LNVEPRTLNPEPLNPGTNQLLFAILNFSPKHKSILYDQTGRPEAALIYTWLRLFYFAEVSSFIGANPLLNVFSTIVRVYMN
jgi:hypothetical protein